MLRYIEVCISTLLREGASLHTKAEDGSTPISTAYSNQNRKLHVWLSVPGAREWRTSSKARQACRVEKSRRCRTADCKSASSCQR